MFNKELKLAEESRVGLTELRVLEDRITERIQSKEQNKNTLYADLDTRLSSLQDSTLVSLKDLKQSLIRGSTQNDQVIDELREEIREAFKKTSKSEHSQIEGLEKRHESL